MIDPGHYPKLIGARLRELREARGLTCVGLSRLADVARQNVSQTELGKACTPTLTTLARYAAALGVDIIDILSCLSPSEVPPALTASGGLSGTSQPGRSHPPGLAATGHLALDAPFGLADVRVAAESFAQSIVAARADVQAPVDVVGASAACSDSLAGVLSGPPGCAREAVDLPGGESCS